MASEMRIDKYLWAVRIFKTRSKASEACGKGQVMINSVATKSARSVKPSDTIQIKRPPITYSFRVKAIPPSRVGAKLVEEYVQNTTSPDQIAMLELIKLDRHNQRAKGMGRPTKKERRSLDAFFGNDLSFIDLDDDIE